jgi:hypothetical protein
LVQFKALATKHNQQETRTSPPPTITATKYHVQHLLLTSYVYFMLFFCVFVVVGDVVNAAHMSYNYHQTVTKDLPKNLKKKKNYLITG